VSDALAKKKRLLQHFQTINNFSFSSHTHTNRHCCCFFFTDELSREEDVLEWLIENKSTGDDEDVIEEVNAKTLGTLIQNIDNLVVVFCRFSWTFFRII
jgi:hypothetical protein